MSEVVARDGITNGITGFLFTVTKTVLSLPVVVLYIAESFLKSLIPKYFKRHNLKGKTILITGAGSGIGRELAVLMGKKHLRVIIWGRKMQNLEATKQMIVEDGGFCEAYKVDVTDPDAVYAAAEKILQAYGKVDILVNNAGVVSGKNLLELKDEEIRNTYNVNAISHYYTSRAFLPKMMSDNSGHIVTVASMAGYIGVNRLTDYCASKFAAVGFSESLSLELKVAGCTGVATTLVCSYFINTGMFTGISSPLLPVENPTSVAKSMVDAIETRSRYCLPFYGGALCLAYTILPAKVLQMFAGLTGFTSSLNKFKGRRALNVGANSEISNGF